MYFKSQTGQLKKKCNMAHTHNLAAIEATFLDEPIIPYFSFNSSVMKACSNDFGRSSKEVHLCARTNTAPKGSVRLPVGIAEYIHMYIWIYKHKYWMTRPNDLFLVFPTVAYSGSSHWNPFGHTSLGIQDESKASIVGSD